jgi:hypothetical protein
MHMFGKFTADNIGKIGHDRRPQNGRQHVRDQDGFGARGAVADSRATSGRRRNVLMPSITITATFTTAKPTRPLAVSNAVRTWLRERTTKRACRRSRSNLKPRSTSSTRLGSRSMARAWPEGTTGSTPVGPQRSRPALDQRQHQGRQSIQEITGSISTGKLTVHETGATITAKRAQYLTVPLTPALNSRGLPLRSARVSGTTRSSPEPSRQPDHLPAEHGWPITPLYLLRKERHDPAAPRHVQDVRRHGPVLRAQGHRSARKGVAHG